MMSSKRTIQFALGFTMARIYYALIQTLVITLIGPLAMVILFVEWNLHQKVKMLTIFYLLELIAVSNH